MTQKFKKKNQGRPQKWGVLVENCPQGQQKDGEGLIFSTSNINSVRGTVFPRGNTAENPNVLKRVNKASAEGGLNKTFGIPSAKKGASSEEISNQQSRKE